MKRIRFIPIVFFALLAGPSLFAQNQPAVDSTGLPGDNFSLQGALQMFQKASSPEEFEKLINEQNNSVNNLDLDADAEVDYVKVIDKMEKDLHVLVLQVAVSESENQDIAVIEVEKTGSESAMLQIIGDEDIYGEQVIVEPDSGEENASANWSNNSNLSGPNAAWDETISLPVVVNVWGWPSVRFMYGPAYRPWISPWRWRHYPSYWHPWRPHHWHVWHPRVVAYHRPFVVVRTHRVVRAHAFYKPVRVSSVSVRTRNAVAVNNFRVTRTKTVVTGPRGNTAVKTTTKVKGPAGKTRVKSTKVRVRRN
jgi:hypothetical protein